MGDCRLVDIKFLIENICIYFFMGGLFGIMLLRKRVWRGMLWEFRGVFEVNGVFICCGLEGDSCE